MTALPEIQGRVLMEGRDGWRTQSLTVDAQRAVAAMGLTKTDLRKEAQDDALSVWDIRTGERLRILPAYSDGVDAAAYSPHDGALLVAGVGGGQGRLGFWPSEGAAALREMQGFPDLSALQSIAFSNDGRQVLLGGGQSQQHALLVLYDLEKASVVHRFEKLDAAVMQAGFSSDARVILARLRASAQLGKKQASLEQPFRVWDTEGFRLLSFGRRPLPCRVNAFSFLSEGTVAAMAMEGLAEINGKSRSAGWIELWDVQRNKQVLALARPHENFFVHDLAVSKEGRWMLTASGQPNADPRVGDCCVRLWDLHACKVVREMFGHKHPVSRVAFVGEIAILSADQSGELRSWPPPTHP